MAAGIKKNLETPWDARLSAPITRRPHVHPHNTSYYGKCMLGGVLACGLTHAAIVPLDVLKCRMQVSPSLYPNLISSCKKVIAEEGVSGLKLGWVPTLAGYSAQGMLKFGLYEYFKDFYGNLAGEQAMSKYGGLVWLGASASAEFFADIALCPFEMVKVKVQTSAKGAWPTSYFAAHRKMLEMKSETRYPFGSLSPLWSRQIPYTMAKFYCFERVVQFFYDNVFTQPKDTYSKPTQLGITFSSGYIAGVVCAIVSHPADSLVSQLGKAENKGKSIGTIMKEVGLVKLSTGGLGTRILMIGSLTGLQWWIYDTLKSALGMGTTGGGSTKKSA